MNTKEQIEKIEEEIAYEKKCIDKYRDTIKQQQVLINMSDNRIFELNIKMFNLKTTPNGQ